MAFPQRHHHGRLATGHFFLLLFWQDFASEKVLTSSILFFKLTLIIFLANQYTTEQFY